jgi:Dock homology region 2
MANKGSERSDPHHQHNRSFSATVFSSTGSTGTGCGSRKSIANPYLDETDRSAKATSRKNDFLGVDNFCFVQPIDDNIQKEWWKAGDFMSKCLRVFELQVAEPFPACVVRQKVIQRNRYIQSPLEAAIDALCQWCAVLFRTAVATTGIRLLAMSNGPGIGTDASKIVADCIHNSHVKEIAATMLIDPSNLVRNPDESDDCLLEEEVYKLQLKLARLVVTFIELLHLLIAKNREELLEVIKDRKKGEGSSRQHQGSSTNGSNRVFIRAQSLGPQNTVSAVGPGWPPAGPPSIDQNPILQRQISEGLQLEHRPHRAAGGSEDNHSFQSTITNPGLRTDSAIAVQSELQRSFIGLTKSLHQKIHYVMRDETPSWLAQCSQEHYFSRGTYKNNRMPIVDELSFDSFENPRRNRGMTSGGNETMLNNLNNNTSLHSEHGYESPRAGSISGQSQRSHNSGLSRTSYRVPSTSENY